ncbi:RHS repeat-associated core domain-containing protein [Sphingobacterium sp. ML3W]|uniref:RHS repeat-associated core domain-containing protein n=1 Tax=Sphingobacterium sp. ML3W TaxID=1538644 RepID=UPI0006904762|nr:RHS repeat-associated core domain-containing protein [Sphingobacterium sp. ML3W]
MLLTNNHFTPVIGIDLHFNTLPPFNPIHPYIGIVIDPMDYIPFIGSSVNVNGIPRGVTDTGGRIITFVHIPLFTGPFAMTPVIGHESMNFFGSKDAYMEGRRISPKGYMEMTCNDIGIPLSLSPGKKWWKPVPSLFAPTSMSLPIPTGNPVNIAGPYVPDLMGIFINLAAGLGFGVLMKGLGKVLSSMLKKLNKLAKKAAKGPNRLSNFLCKHGFEPVDLIQGIVFYETVDFELPGPIPLIWTRIWNSDASYDHQLGHGCHFSYSLDLEIHYNDSFIGVMLADGRSVGFPLLEDEQEFYHRMERLTLKRIGNNYTVYHHTDQLTYHYDAVTDARCVATKISNVAGLAICLHYVTGVFTGITDSGNRELAFDLDGSKRITAVYLITKKGKELLVGYRYDKEGDLIAILDALEQATTITYDNHLMGSKTDRNGQTFYWEYDKQGRCIHTWGDGGVLEGRLAYYPELGYNVITDALGNESLYYYNEDFLCTQIQDALGNSKFFEYTDMFELYREIDEEGNLTGYTYDDKGNLTSVIQPDSTRYTYVYDENDRLIIANDPEGNSRIWNYDESGLLGSTVAPDKGITAFQYNDQGLVCEIRDVSKRRTRLEYDDQHNLTKMFLAQTKVATWVYNDRGEVDRSTDPLGDTQKFSYDALGRVTQIIHADNSSVQLQYNAYDEVIHARNNHHDVRFEYTPMGNLKVREENGTKVQFTYNKNEELIHIQNEHLELYQFKRNGNGDVVEEIGFDGLKKGYHRDRAGKVIRIQRPDERWTEYEYNLRGQIIRSEYYDQSWETYSYDKRGLLVGAVNEQISVQLKRNAMGRIIEDQQGEHQVQSRYNRNGQRTAVTSSLGADIQHEYDTLGNLIATQAGTKDLENSWRMQMQYNKLGQEISRTMSGAIQSNWEYDTGGHPIVHQVKTEKGTVRHRRYSWSANNRLWKMFNELTQGQTDYAYDAFGNLAWAKYEDGQYDYKLPDEVGNLFETKERKDKQYAEGGRLIRDKDFFYCYDAEGNLIEKTGKESWKYQWQGNGMLKQVERPNGTKVTFEYDALGRRTAKIVEKNITRFVWDGNTPLHEWNYAVENRPEWIVDDIGFLQQDQPESITSDCITWVFEEGTFKPTAKIIGNQKYSIVTDYLGTPCQAFDEKGEKVWEMELDIYGKRRNIEGASSFIPFRFQGKYEDIETGLHYNRYRYYNPNSGMYLSQDPIGLAGGNPTVYAYVYDSNTQIDPFGLDLHHIISQEVYKVFKNDLKNIKDYVQNVSKKAKDISNLIDLDKPFHGNHPKYNEYVKDKVQKLIDKNNLNLKSIRKLQNEMLGHIDNALKSGKNLNTYFKEGLHLKNKIKCH